MSEKMKTSARQARERPTGCRTPCSEGDSTWLSVSAPSQVVSGRSRSRLVGFATGTTYAGSATGLRRGRVSGSSSIEVVRLRAARTPTLGVAGARNTTGDGRGMVIRWPRSRQAWGPIGSATRAHTIESSRPVGPSPITHVWTVVSPLCIGLIGTGRMQRFGVGIPPAPGFPTRRSLLTTIPGASPVIGGTTTGGESR